jgi:hypothetical protein
MDLTGATVIMRDFIYPLFVGTAVIWAPLLCGYIAWGWWLEYVRKLKVSEAKFSIIEIKIPKEVFKSPAAIEVMLNSMYGDTRPPLFTKGVTTEWSKLITDFGKFYGAAWIGAWPLWWSLEIASIEGNIYFFIRCEPKNRETIENLLYSQFPQAEITEVDDYTKYVPPFKAGGDWDLRGCEYKLKETFAPDPTKDKVKIPIDALPLKTYVDYGLHDSFNLEEEQKIDPMVPFLQAIGSIGQQEQVWLQIVMQGTWAHFENPDATKKDKKPFVSWQDVGKYYLDNAILKRWQKKLRDDDHPTDTVEKNGVQVAKTITVYSSGYGDLPPAEKEKVEAIDRKLIKSGYDSGIRMIYIAKTKNFNKNKFGEIKNALKQLGAPNRTTLEAINGTDDGFDFPWQDYRDLKKFINREKMFKRFVRREFFYPPEMGATVLVKEILDRPLVNGTLGKPTTSVLGVEELATIFHFPGTVAKTSALSRVEAQKAEPPANLPI